MYSFSLVFLYARRFSLSPLPLCLFIFEPLEIPLFLPFISPPSFSPSPTNVSFSHSFFISLILILLIAFLSLSSFFPIILLSCPLAFVLPPLLHIFTRWWDTANNTRKAQGLLNSLGRYITHGREREGKRERTPVRIAHRLCGRPFRDGSMNTMSERAEVGRGRIGSKASSPRFLDR